MKSPVSWLSNDKYASASLPERLVAWADSQVGVKESPLGSNKGVQVNEYQEVAGLGKGGGFFWCACFIYWCAIKAGFKASDLPAIGKCASVYQWYLWAEKNGLLCTSPARGRIGGWFDRSSKKGHIFICIGSAVKLIGRTIEGNTNELGSRNGDCVAKRTRSVAASTRTTVRFWIDLTKLRG